MNSNVNGAASLSMAIGRFVSGLEFGALSPTDITTLKFGIMDCLACVIAGSREPVTRMVLDTIVPEAGEDKKATVLAHSVHSTALGAALANGVMAHACDFDDVSDPMCGHPTAPALPAILAAGELTDRSGRDVLLAYAAAIEVMTKLGRVAGYELYQSGWHATAALGVFGAAAGAAKILGLDAEHTATAIGIAASRVAGIRANIGSMVKPMHCGFAARDGLEAALLAAAGATASPNALEGTNGFLDTYISQGGRSTDVASLLGNPFDIREPGIVFKKYPSCLDTHSAIDAILELRNRHNIRPEHVRSIRCVLAPGVGGDLAYHAPQAPMEGKFSMEFCSAVALAQGRVSLAEFSQEVVDDPVIQRLINISKLDFDPELTSPNPRSFCAAARVEISLEDGRVIDKTVQYMRGHPENPMAEDEFVSKFKDCATFVLSPANTARALTMIKQVDQLSDLSLLTSALAADCDIATARKRV